jgi:hypothetical protein
MFVLRAPSCPSWFMNSGHYLRPRTLASPRGSIPDDEGEVGLVSYFRLGLLHRRIYTCLTTYLHIWGLQSWEVPLW